MRDLDPTRDDGGRRRRARLLVALLGAVVLLALLGFARGPGALRPRHAHGRSHPGDRHQPPAARRHPHAALRRRLEQPGRRLARPRAPARGRRVPEPAHHGLGRRQPREVARSVRLRQPRRARRADARHRGDARDHALLRARLDEGRGGGLDRLVEARAGARPVALRRLRRARGQRSRSAIPTSATSRSGTSSRASGVPSLHRYDYEGYTELYNRVYDAVKAVRPDAQIGGPYAVITSYSPHAPSSARAARITGPYGTIDQRPLDAIMYWLEHKHGADFITLDAGTDNKDGGSTGSYAGAQKFADVAAWLRKLPADQYPGARTLPLWWAEWKAEASPASKRPRLPHVDRRLRARDDAAKRRVGRPDLGRAGRRPRHGRSRRALHGHAVGRAAERATPLVGRACAGCERGSHPGTRLVRAETSSTSVDVLASATNVMLVNHSSRPKSVRVRGEALPARSLRRAASPASAPDDLVAFSVIPFAAGASLAGISGRRMAQLS